jgi:hypothetical protein
MAESDRTLEEAPIAQLLAEAELSGTDIHKFWIAPRSTQLDRYRTILLTTLEIARQGGYPFQGHSPDFLKAPIVDLSSSLGHQPEA